MTAAVVSLTVALVLAVATLIKLAMERGRDIADRREAEAHRDEAIMDAVQARAERDRAVKSAGEMQGQLLLARSRTHERILRELGPANASGALRIVRELFAEPLPGSAAPSGEGGDAGPGAVPPPSTPSPGSIRGSR